MKILISSITCLPYGGSEGFYGWRACRTLASKHEIWILVEEGCREQLERAAAEGLVPPTMHFIFLGEKGTCHENRMIARLQSWWGYIRFNRSLLTPAREWHAKIQFDLAHLVTYTTWRVGCPLWKLGIPFVWGPISGTEEFPMSGFKQILSPAARAFEVFRIVSGKFSRLSASVRNTAKHSTAIVACHSSALPLLEQIRGRREGLSVLCNLFYTKEQIEAIRRRDFRKTEGPLKIFASGNLEGRKGVALAIQALARVRGRGIRFQYTISSRGPEIEHLQSLTRQLGLEDYVIFSGGVPREHYFENLRSMDVYLLPSLREGAGQTMMEAMLAGCVPVVADANGPAEIVTDASGYRLPVTTEEDMVRDICETICALDADRALLVEKSRAAAARIANDFSEEHWLKTLDNIYEKAVAGQC